MTEPLGRRLFAEALGSVLLAGVVIGSGILADQLSPDDGVALIGNTLATAAILAVLILSFGPISGAHLNPAVSLVMALRGEMKPQEAVAYAVTQCLGCVAGAVLAHAMFGLPLIQASTVARAGPELVLSEAVATFALVMTILMVSRNRPQATPWAVALVITAGYWWTSSTSFANPAITLARSFTDTFAGVRLIDAPGFVLGQVGGSLAALVAFAVLVPQKPQA